MVDPSTQVLLDWDLGNPGKSTALPVHVTYRPLWPPSGSASNAVYAETVGLPLGLVDGYVVVDSSGEHPPGPGQGVSIAFQANLQPGNYQVTVSPDPPFDQAFPPDVATMPVAVGTQTDEDNLTFDVTNYEQTTSPIVPTFDLSRVGGLVGWTAYLRDATTHGTLSTVATLGAHTSAVTLATNHHPPGGDALTNTQLVLAPPSGSTVPLPGYIVAPQGGVLDSAETVPALPPAVTVTGNVTDADGVTPVEADLFFESIAGATTPQGIYTAGPPLTLNTGNFEYTGQASARLDAVDSPSSYSVHLPPGEYQLTVRPLDTGHAVTVQTALLLAPSSTPLTTNVVAALPRSVTGAAALADGRPLGGATVEAVPTQCAQGNSPLCMPRASSTTTAADGSWALSLDPGGYVLRIEPADGTRFPWVTESLLVGPTDVVVPPVTVPAPVYAGMKLRDPVRQSHRLLGRAHLPGARGGAGGRDGRGHHRRDRSVQHVSGAELAVEARLLLVCSRGRHGERRPHQPAGARGAVGSRAGQAARSGEARVHPVADGGVVRCASVGGRDGADGVRSAGGRALRGDCRGGIPRGARGRRVRRRGAADVRARRRRGVRRDGGARADRRAGERPRRSAGRGRRRPPRRSGGEDGDQAEHAQEVLRIAALLAQASDDVSPVEREVLGKLAKACGLEDSEVEVALDDVKTAMSAAG